MNINRLKELFHRAPSYSKAMMISAALLMLSVFFPWYRDTDVYHTGDQFLGVTGPASFVGLSIFVLAVSSLLLTTYKIIGRRLVKLPWKESSFHVFVATESFFLLSLTTSIYLDIDFGVNLPVKEMLFGMTVALLSSIGLGVGAYFMKKQEALSGSNDSEGDLKPLIRVPERTHSTVQNQSRTTQQASHSPVPQSEFAEVAGSREVESQQMGF